MGSTALQDHAGSRGEDAVRGGAIIAASSASRFLVRLGVTVVLARLLTPEEFGLVAMVTAVIAIGLVCQEMGLSAATVQRAQVSTQAISTLLWINAAMGVLIALVFAASASAIAWFYGRPELVGLCVAASPVFLLGGWGVQYRALLQRDMRFSVQARVNALAPLLGGIAAIAMAWRGAGIWALVAQLLVTELVTLILLRRAVSIALLRPALTDEVREMLRFGVRLFGFQLLYGFALNLYVVLLGRTTGAIATGLYTRAQALVVIPQSLVYMSAGHVSLPRLSQLQGSDQAFANFYYRGLRLTSLANAPIVALFLLYADSITWWAYGPQWGEVPVLLRIFCLGMVAAPIIHSASQVFAARGEGGRFLRWGAFSAAVMSATALIGVQWGLRGIAWGWSLSSVLLLWPCLAYAYRGSLLTVAGALRACLPAYAAAVCTLPVGLLMERALLGLSPWWQLPLCALAFVSAYLALACFLFGQRALVFEVLARVRRRRAG